MVNLFSTAKISEFLKMLAFHTSLPSVFPVSVSTAYLAFREPVLTFSLFCRRIAGREREIQVYQRGAGHNLCRAGWLLNDIINKNQTRNANCRFTRSNNNNNHNISNSSKRPRTFDSLAFDLIYSKQLTLFLTHYVFLCSCSPCYFHSAR